MQIKYGVFFIQGLVIVNSALAFLAKLNSLKDGYHYPLPAEAEWEYAARAGTTGPYYGNLDAIGWYQGNSGLKTHPVWQKQANGFGLYDMVGSVQEWCPDSSGPHIVPRGASWDSVVWSARVTYHMTSSPDYRAPDFGFGVCREPL